MNPLDPKETQHKQNESPMAPPYVEENDDIELNEMGLEVAEDEKRDAVTDKYETLAKEADEPEETLDDIAYPKDGR